ncbi:pyruvate flavodoxin/ferredoxin oxidoreductase [Chloroflexota bacterium]
MPEFINGAEAIVRGALHSGCNFFAGYPITPATPILTQMSQELPKVGGVAIQAEDEIAAIGMCIGAALTGARVLTATSGPGISLYSENIGLAIMGEVPMVIVDCQRMGPATGGATTVAQGDIQFLRWGTSGGYPVIVLAPSNVADCYTLTRKAFDLSERFRVPVFLAADKETVTTRSTIFEEAFEAIPVRERKYADEQTPFIPYQFPNLTDVPPMTPFGGPHLLRFTTSSHDERGYMSKQTDDLNRLNNHLRAKIIQHVDEISLVEIDLQENADTLLVSYGISAQAIFSAANELRNKGLNISTLVVYSLWPVPEREILTAIQGIRRIIVAELNHGQYQREIERLAAPEQEILGIHKVNGELITEEEIIERCT